MGRLHRAPGLPLSTRPGPRPSRLPAAGCTAAARRCRRHGRSPSRRTSSPRHSGPDPSDPSAAARRWPTRSASSSSPGWSFRSMAKFWHLRPVGAGGGGLEAFHGRRDELAGLVPQLRRGQMVLLGVGAFDIADAAPMLRTVPATPSLPLAPAPAGHFTLVDDAHLAPSTRGLCIDEVVGEHEGRAGAVGAVHRGDGQAGQLHAVIELGDLRIVPLGDLAEIDVGQQPRRSASARSASRRAG